MDIRPTHPVPVDTLMCSDLRMSTILQEEHPVHRKEMPVFLSLVYEALVRWYEAVGTMNPLVFESYDEHMKILNNLRDAFNLIVTDDSEMVFQHRVRLAHILSTFYSLMDSFASAFQSPQYLREFYYNINSRLRLTENAILEGSHGW